MRCHAQETYEKNLKAVQELEGLPRNNTGAGYWKMGNGRQPLAWLPIESISWHWIMSKWLVISLDLRAFKDEPVWHRIQTSQAHREGFADMLGWPFEAPSPSTIPQPKLSGCRTLQFDEMKIGTSEPARLSMRMKILFLHTRSLGVPQHVHMEATLSSLPVDADNGEEDANDNADKDQTATLEEECEALQNILSVTVDT
ncbi:hypothetical protein EDD16DRAFT_1527890 [Pisolithus croceorrhizus]|nr:hypothetical protein EDD16DRAFT_1527890 [Pisolithus croceorrhizus]